MRDYIILGLTGQTGSGKSTVAQYIKTMNCEIIDTDAIAREALKPNTICNITACKIFGEDIRLQDGNIDRKLLAERAFSSKENSKLLNDITHPWIIRRSFQMIKELHIKKKTDIYVIDAPLLFESHMDAVCDFIVSVVAPKDVRKKRIMNRDNITESQAMARMSVQKSRSFYTENSDYIIDGGVSLQEVYKETEKIINLLRGVFHGKIPEACT